MPLLTPQLMQRIKAIIQKHHRAFVVNAFGQETFPPEVVKELRDQGLIQPEAAATDAAYLYGQVTAALEDPKVSEWSAEKVAEWVKKNPIPLTAAERAAAKTAQLTAAQYCQGLGNTVDKESGQLLIEADHRLREDLQDKIQNATALNIAARETVRQLKTDLGWATRDWTRNLDRIAITEKQNAMQAGVADGIEKRHGDSLVALICAPDACDSCRRLTIGPDGAPRIFRLSQLGHPGANVGRKQVDWVACIGATHPHCQCQVVRIPTGWGFNAESQLVPGGRYGVQTEDAEKSVRMELAYQAELRKAYGAGPVPEEEFNAFVDSHADIEEWEGCCRAVLKEVAKEPGVQFHKLTDRVSAAYGEDLGGRVTLALAKTGALKRDEKTDRFYPTLEKGRKLAGKVMFQDLPVSIEQDVGHVREWYDVHAKEAGQTVMKYPYGYIRGTEGSDGDQVDVYLGPNPRADQVFIVHQKKKLKTGGWGGYDEDKCMLGFSNPDEAKRAYLEHYNDPGFFGGMSVMSMAAFKRSLESRKGKALVGVTPESLDTKAVATFKEGLEKAADAVFTLRLDKSGQLNDFPQGAPDRMRYSESMEADRGVVTGGGANLQGKLPPRPIGGTNDATGMAAWLQAGQPRTSVLYRDPKVYEFDQDTPDAIFTLRLDNGVGMGIHREPDSDDVMLDRGTLERMALREAVVPRNTANVGFPMLGGAVLSEEPVRDPVQTDNSVIQWWDDDAQMEKALFIGPRGGKWADAKHTIPYDPKLHGEVPADGGGRTRVVVHHPGEKPPPGVKWGNHPGPGYSSTLNFKGKDYHVTFGHEAGKFTGTLQLPGGKMHAITSPNHAANMVMLHSKGLEPTLNSYELKKLGIAYPANRLFRFGESKADAAKPAPPPAPVAVEPEVAPAPPAPIAASPEVVGTPAPPGMTNMERAARLGYETARNNGNRAPILNADIRAMVGDKLGSPDALKLYGAFIAGYQKHSDEQAAAVLAAPDPVPAPVAAAPAPEPIIQTPPPSPTPPAQTDVIGATKTGKPIHLLGHSRKHEDFTSAEHREAAELHEVQWQVARKRGDQALMEEHDSSIAHHKREAALKGAEEHANYVTGGEVGRTLRTYHQHVPSMGDPPKSKAAAKMYATVQDNLVKLHLEDPSAPIGRTTTGKLITVGMPHEGLTPAEHQEVRDKMWVLRHALSEHPDYKRHQERTDSLSREQTGHAAAARGAKVPDRYMPGWKPPPPPEPIKPPPTAQEMAEAMGVNVTRITTEKDKDKPAGWDRMPERITSQDQVDPNKRYTIWTKIVGGTRKEPTERWVHERTFPGAGFAGDSGKAAYIHGRTVDHGEPAVFPEGFDPNTGTTTAPAPEPRPSPRVGPTSAVAPIPPGDPSPENIFRAPSEAEHAKYGDVDPEGDNPDIDLEYGQYELRSKYAEAEEAQDRARAARAKGTAEGHQEAARAAQEAADALREMADMLGPGGDTSQRALELSHAQEVHAAEDARVQAVYEQRDLAATTKQEVEAAVQTLTEPTPEPTSSTPEEAAVEPVKPVEEAGIPKDETELQSRQRAREVGKHIESSRKDIADIMGHVKAGNLDKVSYADAARLLRKESLMPALTAGHYKDLGATPGAAHLALTISSLVAGKPKDDDASRRAYMDGVRMITGGLERIKTMEHALAFQQELQKHARNAGKHERPLTQEEMAILNGPHLPGKDRPQHLLEQKMAAELGMPSRDMNVAYEYGRSADGRQPDGTYKNARFIWVNQAERKQIHDMYRALGPRFIAGINLSVPKTADTGRPWGEAAVHRFNAETAFGRARIEAQRLDKEGWEEFEKKDAEKAKLAADPTAPAEPGKERRKAWKRNASEEPELKGVGLVQRADPKAFAEKFRLTSVQPGENIPDAEYEFHLRQAETALHTLADVVGVEPADISLNGRLGLAFAARGRGKASAHYEPNQKAINITRFRGAGSVAHEWGHFLDNVMAEAHGGKGTSGRGEYASEGAGKQGMPAELAAAFQGLHAAMHMPDIADKARRQRARLEKLAELEKKAKSINDDLSALRSSRYVDGKPTEYTPEVKQKINDLLRVYDEVKDTHDNVRRVDNSASEFLQHARALDGGKGGSFKKAGYWSQGTEMFARCFESYVQDKLEDNKRRNSYLVDGTREHYRTQVPMPDGKDAQPYPQGEERKRINAAFDILLGVMRNGGHLKKALDTMSDLPSLDTP